jgi:3-oxoacyl-[acyl-carrier-protein] synthase II
LAEGEAPATLNYETPDPACPVNIIHGRPLLSPQRTFVKISSSRLGQSAALVIAAD